MFPAIVVDAYVISDDADEILNLYDDVASIAVDQRMFGPRQLLVAFGSIDGRLLGLAHTGRTDPPDVGLRCCLDHFLGHSGFEEGRVALVVAASDEVLDASASPPELSVEFGLALEVCDEFDVTLIDWIACDDGLYRSSRAALGLELF